MSSNTAIALEESTFVVSDRSRGISPDAQNSDIDFH